MHSFVEMYPVPSLSVGALKGQGSITNHLWTADLITSPSSDKTETKQYSPSVIKFAYCYYC